MPASQQQPAWRRTMGRRLAIVAAGFACFLVAVIVRLVILQVFHYDFYEAWSRDQREDDVKVAAERGEIVDRNGKLLATSVDWTDVWVKRKAAGDPQQFTATLCEALRDCDAAEKARIVKELVAKRSGQARVRRQVDPEQARRIAALKLNAVSLVSAPHRCYPNRELAAHVLGYVGTDHNGLAGVELAYESLLKGKEGHLLLQMLGGRNPTPYRRGGTAPTPGKTLELTIDANLQFVAEQALRDAVRDHRALGGSVLVMVPQTGEILALANEPTFNPNNINLYPDDARKNRAVGDTYEPGSTFKLVTASAAIEEKVLRPTDMIDTGNGILRIGSRVIDEFKQHQYGTLSVTDVIVKSSNVGAAKIGLQVGPERISRYVERFGFGTRELRRELPGESAGQVSPLSDLNDSAVASMSMGYQVGVTAIQMAVAASAIANQGELVEPHVLRAVIDGRTRKVLPRRVRHRVVSPATAAEVTAMMEAVVERGTAKLAQLPGFTVAGKTGTATKVVNGRYVETDNVVSFVGFVPSRRPALTILVVIDTPRIPAGHPSGGVVAAPIFKRIAEAALPYLGVAPSLDPAPPVLVVRGGQQAIPVSHAATPVTFVPAAAPATAGQVVLPDLRGLAGREALRVLARMGLTPRLSGDGMVVEQDPPAGSPVDFGASCRLVLSRTLTGIQP